jgi:hypothetical protein
MFLTLGARDKVRIDAPATASICQSHSGRNQGLFRRATLGHHSPVDPSFLINSDEIAPKIAGSG